MDLYSFSIYQRRLYRRQNVWTPSSPTRRFVANTFVPSPLVNGTYKIRIGCDPVSTWTEADLTATNGPSSSLCSSASRLELGDPFRVKNDQCYWLFATVDPDTTRLLHVRLFPTRSSALTEMFLSELREKHLVSNAIFLRWPTLAAGGLPPTLAPIPTRHPRESECRRTCIQGAEKQN